MQRLKLPTRPDTALLSALILKRTCKRFELSQRPHCRRWQGKLSFQKLICRWLGAAGGLWHGVGSAGHFVAAGYIAIPLSSITIFGGAVGNFFLNLSRIRDNLTKPLIGL
ncbi:unnamed protein product [Peronospora destructor]|uniref:Uncharacterized protein n=1 Tax=Peronospora destructor TaxID=86335 RepID=A0AAV0UYG5_9STRA|nr:unnamed protein product [Peronospora destructor]